jgi:predicted ATPase
VDATRTTFFGREGDIEAALRLLQAGERLVTLVGPAGVGKTRLARELAARVGGVVQQLDLHHAHGAEKVAARVAAVIGERLFAWAGMSAVDQVGMALARTGPRLLVIDDFDHLVRHAEATVGRWLAMAPQLRLLVTSRQALGIAGELRHEVLPLAIDDAIELFAARVRAVSPRFVMTPESREIARQIVLRLDRLPLAIELAAARASLLSPAEILARLDRRLEVLRVDAGHRVGSNHSTLRGALEWSWSLLDEPDRRALAAMAVFTGGISIPAAAAVLGVSEPDAIDRLASLRDRSLLVPSAVLGDRAAGETRLELLDSVGELAVEKLDERGERDEFERRHAAHYLAAAERWAAAAHGPDAGDALRQLRIETGNLVAAARVSLRREPEVAIRLALALGEALALSGPLVLQLDLLDHAVAAAFELPDHSSLLARALLLRGDARAVVGQRAEAFTDLERAARQAREAGERKTEARALYLLGAFQRDDGNFSEARAHLERAAELFVADKDSASVGAAVGSLATMYRQQGRFAVARVHYERALEQHRIGDRTAEGKVLAGLGHIEAAMRRPAEANALYEAALPLLRAVGDRRTEGVVLDRKGLLALERGDPAAALPLFDAARAQLVAIGDRRLEAVVVAHRAVALGDLARTLEARQDLADAARAIEPIDDTRLKAALLAVSACVDRSCAQNARDPDLADLLRESGQKSAREAADAERRLATIPADAAYVEYLSDALRLLDRPGAASAPASDSRLVEVGPTSTWIRLAGGKKITLSPLLARLLDQLVEQRLARPGVSLAPEVLAERLWPEERPDPRLAGDRVHAAISRLRRRGLEGLLVHQGGGYLLHPAFRCERRPA